MLGCTRVQGMAAVAGAADSDAEDSDEEPGGGAGGYDADESWIEQEVSAEDEAALAAWAAPDQARRPARSLADIILEKIAAKQAGEGAPPLPQCAAHRLLLFRSFHGLLRPLACCMA